jgi:hypothetical protein
VAPAKISLTKHQRWKDTINILDYRMTGETKSTTVESDELVLFVDHADPVQIETTQEVRAGDLCPQCKEERLDYNGLLNLACPKCGYALGGCFT